MKTMKAPRKKASFTSAKEYKDLLLHLLPGQGEWSEEKYLWLTDHTNRLVEFTDGLIEVLPMPTDRHQGVLEFMYLAFRAFLQPMGGRVRFAGLRLRIRDGKFRQPDLLLLKSAKDPRRQNRFWEGADLSLEVVSPDKPERDLVDKRHDYAEGGVPEYWIVNPQTETITVLNHLRGKAYRRQTIFRRGEIATSPTLVGFSVKVDEVLDAD